MTVIAKDTASQRAGKIFGDEMVAHIPYLRAFARSLCRNRQQADDLIQETMIRGWTARKSFEPGTNMRAWLLKILRNCFYSDLRRAKRTACWSDEVADRVLVARGAQMSALELGDLHRAMAALPHEQREALILVGAGGLAYEEAAAICDCAVGTIKSRVSRARKAMLALLLDESAPAQEKRTRGEDAMREIYGSLDALMGAAFRAGAFDAAQCGA